VPTCAWNCAPFCVVTGRPTVEALEPALFRMVPALTIAVVPRALLRKMLPSLAKSTRPAFVRTALFIR